MINFGNEQIGNEKVIGQQIILTNTGSTAIGLTGSSIKGPSALDFVLDSRLPPTVMPGANFSSTLKFVPTVVGERTATLEITTDCRTLPEIDITLTGTAK
jgi:hypothetical protein